MRRCLVVLGLAVPAACAGPRALEPASRTAQVRPGVLEWNIGIDQEGGQKEGPSPLVEVILPATYRGRAVWRVVHRDADPTTPGSAASYDMYDVDRATLVPVRSIMSREGLYLALAFDAGKVTIDTRDENGSRRDEVTVRDPMPEGPGLTVLLASLPLRAGFRTSFAIVDRWDEAARVKQMDLVVGASETIRTPLGRCDAREVTLAARDGTVRIRAWVRTEPPHYPLKMEYIRGELALVSEVARMVLDDAPAACASPR
ncbi:MAG TPA: hypothetical protein VKE22_00180 [Haliangiales bacterium]|nr:hypothetical protein [Haliangiales bacterium]